MPATKIDSVDEAIQRDTFIRDGLSQHYEGQEVAAYETHLVGIYGRGQRKKIGGYLVVKTHLTNSDGIHSKVEHIYGDNRVFSDENLIAAIGYVAQQIPEVHIARLR